MTTFFLRRRQARLERPVTAKIDSAAVEAVQAAPPVRGSGLSPSEQVVALMLMAIALGNRLTVAVKTDGEYGLGISVLLLIFILVLGRRLMRRLATDYNRSDTRPTDNDGSRRA